MKYFEKYNYIMNRFPISTNFVSESATENLKITNIIYYLINNYLMTNRWVTAAQVFQTSCGMIRMFHHN